MKVCPAAKRPLSCAPALRHAAADDVGGVGPGRQVEQEDRQAKQAEIGDAEVIHMPAMSL